MDSLFYHQMKSKYNYYEPQGQRSMGGGVTYKEQ